MDTYKLHTKTKHTTSRDNILTLKNIQQSVETYSAEGQIESTSEIYSDEAPGNMTLSSSVRVLTPLTISDAGIGAACKKNGIVKGRYSVQEASEMTTTPSEFTNNSSINSAADIISNFQNIQKLDIHGNENLSGTLDLSGLTDLKEVNVSKTKCSLILPDNGAISSIKEGRPITISQKDVSIYYDNCKVADLKTVRTYYTESGESSYMSLPATTVTEYKNCGVKADNYSIDNTVDLQSVTLNKVKGDFINLLNVMIESQQETMFEIDNITGTLHLKACSINSRTGEPLPSRVTEQNLQPVEISETLYADDDLKIVKAWKINSTLSNQELSGLSVTMDGKTDMTDYPTECSEVIFTPVPYDTLKLMLKGANSTKFKALMTQMGFTEQDMTDMLETIITEDNVAVASTKGMYYSKGNGNVPCVNYSTKGIISNIDIEFESQTDVYKKILYLHFAMPKYNLKKIAGLCGGICVDTGCWMGLDSDAIAYIQQYCDSLKQRELKQYIKNNKNIIQYINIDNAIIHSLIDTGYDRYICNSNTISYFTFDYYPSNKSQIKTNIRYISGTHFCPYGIISDGWLYGWNGNIFSNYGDDAVLSGIYAISKYVNRFINVEQNTNLAYLDDELVYTHNLNIFTSSNKLALFRNNTHTDNKIQMKFFEIKEENNLLHEFIPYKVNDEIQLLDIVTEQLATKVGTFTIELTQKS